MACECQFLWGFHATLLEAFFNSDAPLSLGFFRTVLGLNHISNEADFIKKDGNYECWKSQKL